MKRKYIFVTGGVSSSLGKGVAVSSLGALLEARSLRVSLQKIDPYLNVDPGTMSPFEHGEVYVTDDGAETDLDLGNYERFTTTTCAKANSITAGMIYQTVIEKEREGEYLGKTIQVIPHITNEIKNKIREAADNADSDVAIVEIGGTVGDIESIPFLEAARQFARDEGRENVLYIHLTLVPTLAAANEMKTKPTQHSVKELREIGIHPDILLCRCEKRLSDDMRAKIALFCDVDNNAVISAMDIDTTIYEIPVRYHEQGLDDVVIIKLQLLKAKPLNLNRWDDVVRSISGSREAVSIGVVGKYIQLQDAYKSIYEALAHGGIQNKVRVNTVKLDSEELEKYDEKKLAEVLGSVDGILIPGGFGTRGIEGKVRALNYARTKGIPAFGICLGMQCMVIEYARNMLGFKDANSSEFDIESEHKVISLLAEQETITRKGGTMRKGAYQAALEKDSIAFHAYKKKEISERHRHRYEFTNKYREEFIAKGLAITGTNPELDLVEIVEVPTHPWYLGVQYHPEFQSKPFAPHPLFGSFIEASLKFKKGRV